MPRTYPTIDGGESSCFITPKGGTISLTGDPPRVAGLERITTTPTGVSFGPLKVSTPSLADTEHTVAAIENLRFAPTKGHDPDDSESDWLPSWGDDDGNETNTTTSGLLGLSLGGAAAEADDTQLTRRQTIGVMAGALALGTTTASAQSESDQIKFAEFDLVRSDGPVHVGVLPIVDNALPPDTKLTLTVDGAKRRSWTPADALESASKPNGETITLDGSQRARVEVYAKGGVGTVDELTAWAKGVLAAEREIKATLELGRNPTNMAAEEVVQIDDHPAFVEAVEADGGSESIVTIGEESIPHKNERLGHDRGHYEVKEESLVYVAGPDPPEGTLVQLRLRAGRIASLTDATDRALEL